MSLFNKLKELSKDFDAELQTVSEDLSIVRLAHDHYEKNNKKTRDYSLFLSKLRLLKGKEHAATQPVQECVESDTNIIHNYQETAQNKIISDMLTKYVCTHKVVNELMTKKDRQLDEHERKIKKSILAKHTELRSLDSQLLALDSMLTEHEDMLSETRCKWDRTMGELRDMKTVEKSGNEEGPLFEKLTKLLDKLELMRWLMTCLMLSPSADYDWLSDPDRLAGIRALSRFNNTVENIAMSEE